MSIEQDSDLQLYRIEDLMKFFKVQKKTLYTMLKRCEDKYPEEEFYIKLPIHRRFSKNHINKIVGCLNSKEEVVEKFGKSQDQLTESKLEYLQERQ